VLLPALAASASLDQGRFVPATRERGEDHRKNQRNVNKSWRMAVSIRIGEIVMHFSQWIFHNFWYGVTFRLE